ncbi:hypothetical protein ACFPRL_17860 [Pseudoclavibacter helvolus]
MAPTPVRTAPTGFRELATARQLGRLRSGISRPRGSGTSSNLRATSRRVLPAPSSARGPLRRSRARRSATLACCLSSRSRPRHSSRASAVTSSARATAACSRRSRSRRRSLACCRTTSASSRSATSSALNR